MLLYKNHYFAVHSLNELCNTRTGRGDIWGRKICDKCYTGFKTQELLEIHQTQFCNNQTAQRVIMPKPGRTKKFINFQNTLKSHFCLYCDTECLHELIEISVEDLHWGAVRKLSKHTPIGASAYLDVSKEMLQGMLNINAPGRKFFIEYKLVTFRGRNCMAQLMEHV